MHVRGLVCNTSRLYLQDPCYYVQGCTEGTFKNVKYFTCHDDNGLFVSLDKLSEDPSGRSLPELLSGGQHHTPHAAPQSNTPHAAQENALRAARENNTSHAVQENSTPHAAQENNIPHTGKQKSTTQQNNTPCAGQQNSQAKPKSPPVTESNSSSSRFNVGDCVVVFNKNGTGIRGTVRWAGKYGYCDDTNHYHTIAAVHVGIETVSYADYCMKFR